MSVVYHVDMYLCCLMCVLDAMCGWVGGKMYVVVKYKYKVGSIIFRLLIQIFNLFGFIVKYV